MLCGCDQLLPTITAIYPSMMVGLFLLLWPLSIALFCSAQTTTVTDPDSGLTIVEVITTNRLGLPTTQTLTTSVAANTALTGSSTTTVLSTSTSTPTTTPQAGPVGQPAATTATPGAPTPFTYTTIVNGQTVVATDVFTPTNPATTPVEATASGTVWNLSSYVSQYGQGTSGAVTMSCLGVAASTLLVLQIIGLVPFLFYDFIFL